jgi:hypothetical protein
MDDKKLDMVWWKLQNRIVVAPTQTTIGTQNNVETNEKRQLCFLAIDSLCYVSGYRNVQSEGEFY